MVMEFKVSSVAWLRGTLTLRKTRAFAQCCLREYSKCVSLIRSEEEYQVVAFSGRRGFYPGPFPSQRVVCVEGNRKIELYRRRIQLAGRLYKEAVGVLRARGQLAVSDLLVEEGLEVVSAEDQSTFGL